MDPSVSGTTRTPVFRTLRVLVTNHCNLNCSYCHNEGQVRAPACFLALDRFALVAEAAHATGVRHFQFSGGEPLLHSGLRHMVELAQKLGDGVTIGLATNATLLAAPHFDWLNQTMSNVRVDLPALSPARYLEITGHDCGVEVVGRIRQMRDAGLPVGINVVFYDQHPAEIVALLNFAAEVEADLKILEWVSDSYVEVLRSSHELGDLFAHVSTEPIEAYGSVESFNVRVRNKCVRVRLIHSPCVLRDAPACQERGEVRLRADGVIDSCVCSPRRDRRASSAITQTAVISEIEAAAEEISRCPL